MSNNETPGATTSSHKQHQKSEQEILNEFHKTLINAQPNRFLDDFEKEVASQIVQRGEDAEQTPEVEPIEFTIEEKPYHDWRIKQLHKQAEIAEQTLLQEAENMLQQERQALFNAKGVVTKQTKAAMQRWFDSAKHTFTTFVHKRKADVEGAYGKVQFDDLQRTDKTSVNWARIPQKMEIRVQSIRGIKDKISKDVYVLLISKWNRMGGHVEPWVILDVNSQQDFAECPLHGTCSSAESTSASPSNMRTPSTAAGENDTTNISNKTPPSTPEEIRKYLLRQCCEICQGYAGCTKPKYHGGTHKDVDLAFNSSVVGQFPSETQLMPYHVLTFELIRIEDNFAHSWKLDAVKYLKPRKYNPFDLAPSIGGRGSSTGLRGRRSRTVGWGVFPLTNNKLQLIRGKYKVPMLRGPIDETITHFWLYEDALRGDLEAWLGNLYFEALPYEREVTGKISEFEMDQKYSREVLGLQDVTLFDNKSQWIVPSARGPGAGTGPKRQQPGPHQSVDTQPLLARKNQKSKANFSLQPSFQPPKYLNDRDSDDATESTQATSAASSDSEKSGSTSASSTASSYTKEQNKKSMKKSGFADLWIPNSVRQFAREASASMTHQMNRNQNRLKANLGLDLTALRQFGQSGMLLGEDANKDDTEMEEEEKENLVKELKKFNKLLKQQEETAQIIDKAEKWAKYKFSIEPDGTFAELDYRWYVKMLYVAGAIVDSLYLKYPWSLQFWGLVVALFLVVWVQLFLRGFGLYIGLQILTVPTANVRLVLYGIMVDYKAYYMYPFDEIFIVCIGGIANLLVILILVLIGFLFSRLRSKYPELISKLVYVLSFGLCLMPFVDMVIDAVSGNVDCDWNRLMRFYAVKRYSQFFGAITWLILYFISIVILIIILYFYTMYIHLNGILMDAYHRINMLNEDMAEERLLPLDFEISVPELKYIVEKAERWRGANGERKKTLVEEIVTNDFHDATFREVTVRIAIYIIDVGDPNYRKYCPKRIWREFFVLPRGSIVEAVNHRAPSSTFFIDEANSNVLRKVPPPTTSRRNPQSEGGSGGGGEGKSGWQRQRWRITRAVSDVIYLDEFLLQILNISTYTYNHRE